MYVSYTQHPSHPTPCKRELPMKVGGRSLLEASHSSSSSWPGTSETTVVAANSLLRLGIKSHLLTAGVGEWDGWDPLPVPGGK